MGPGEHILPVKVQQVDRAITALVKDLKQRGLLDSKGGQTYGQTDDIGYDITENPMDVRDLQATILHLLGLDPWRLTYLYQGLEQRFIGVEGKAKLHQALLA